VPTEHQLFPVSIVPPAFRAHLHLHAALTRRTNGRSMETLQKQSSFGNRGALDIKILFGPARVKVSLQGQFHHKTLTFFMVCEDLTKIPRNRFHNSHACFP
jgi:hypothetical protein